MTKEKISKNCCVRLPKDVHNKAKSFAYAHGLTLQEFIYMLVTKAITEEKDEKS